MNTTIPLKGRTLQVLGVEEIEQIHRAVLEVLYDPGVAIDHDEALDLFARAGAEIDHDKRIVHLPSSLVERIVAQAPRQMTMCGRDPRYDMRSGSGVVYTTSGQGCMHVVDFDTGERRLATKKDLENLTRIHDALEHTHMVWAEVNPQDIPQQALHVHMAQTLLNNTEKPCYTEALDGRVAKDLIRMGVAVAGSEEALQKRPMLMTGVGAVSPLCLEGDRVDVLLEFCRAGLPIKVYCIPSAGGTTPVTLAGTLVVQTAECLSAVILAQLIKPGAAIEVHGYASIMDQKYGCIVLGAPEGALLSAAQAQVFRYYGLPHGVVGHKTPAIVPDVQAGYDIGTRALVSALSGASVVKMVAAGVGEAKKTAHYEMAVVSNDIVGMTYRILRGIEVNPDTLAVEVIREVGPRGEFLTHRHTWEHFRAENWEPKVSNRLSRGEYEERGSPDVLKRARAEVKRILATHYPKPLDEDVQKKLQEIVDGAGG